jgi:hypothetical protein
VSPARWCRVEGDGPPSLRRLPFDSVEPGALTPLFLGEIAGWGPPDSSTTVSGIMWSLTSDPRDPDTRNMDYLFCVSFIAFRITA